MPTQHCLRLPLQLQPNQTDVTLFQTFLQETQRTAIITHINPDPDALTSALALYQIKNIVQKANMKIFVESTLTDDLKEIPLANLITQSNNLVTELQKFKPSIIALTDVNHYHRLTTQSIDTLKKFMQNKKIYIFDHHITKPTVNNAHIIQKKLLSTTELLYCLAKNLNIELDTTTKTLLAIGLISDTNLLKTLPNPKHPERILIDIIEDLIKETTIPFHKILHIADVSLLPEMINFINILLENIQIEDNIAYSIADFSNMKSTAKTAIIVRAVAFFVAKILESLPQKVNFVIYKIHNKCFASIRSNYFVNLLPVAEKLGGGGHMYVAGATLSCSPNKDIHHYKNLLLKLLKQQIQQKIQTF